MKKLIFVMMIVCLLTGCGKTNKQVKNDNKQEELDNIKDKNTLDPEDVIDTVNDARKSVAKNEAHSLREVAQYFYMMKLVENVEFEPITFTCDSNECSNGIDKLDIKGDIPSSGTITIDENGNMTFTNIVINGYKCDIPSSGDVVCTK